MKIFTGEGILQENIHTKTWDRFGAYNTLLPTGGAYNTVLLTGGAYSSLLPTGGAYNTVLPTGDVDGLGAG